MNISDFTDLIQNASAISSEQNDALEKIIKRYPFFQAARALHLKNLKNLESFQYSEVLKKTAAYTTDRTVLFDFITSEEFNQYSVAKNISEQTISLKEIDVKEEVIHIQKTDLGTIEEANAVLDPALFEKKEIIEDTAHETTIPAKANKATSFEKDEKHSFSEWLKLTHTKPEAPQNVEETERESDQVLKKKKFDLIDKFIEENPKIIPSKQVGPKLNLAKQYQVEKSVLMTETLAKILLEQKKYKKAIQAYKILSLKYPEKSGFFADRIREIKKLMQNN